MKTNVRQLTKDEAIAFSESDEWKDWPAEKIVEFQFYQDRVCIPQDIFRGAVEEFLGRVVRACEFASAGGLRAECRERKRIRTDPTHLLRKLTYVGNEPLCPWWRGSDVYLDPHHCVHCDVAIPPDELDLYEMGEGDWLNDPDHHRSHCPWAIAVKYIRSIEENQNG